MRYLLLLSFLLLFVSCKKEDPIEEIRRQAAIDEQIISDYLNEHNVTALRHDVEYNEVEYGLYYNITKVGSGAYPLTTSTVSVKYNGYLLDGTLFDSSENIDGLFVTNLRNVIPGWTFGVPLMRPGGITRFYIPSGLAYGPSGAGIIPANAVLIFDITLVNYQ
jgi:FKBP-type peptidyl-prolyl cis-trans isomerase FkpA